MATHNPNLVIECEYAVNVECGIGHQLILFKPKKSTVKRLEAWRDSICRSMRRLEIRDVSGQYETPGLRLFHSLNKSEHHNTYMLITI